jgi:molybdate transport system ATP-binding protein
MPDAGLKAALAVSLGDFSLDAALDVRPGETLALMGPNGAGKTTCLNLIAGLLDLEKGRVSLDGTVLSDTERGVDVDPAERAIGFLFQDAALFPHLTARGNVAYGPRAQGRADAADTASRWIERLDLAALADRPVSALSGGQKQRVALARALASGAKLLLLDEPFAALDASSRAAVRSEMKRFLREAGLPALVVAHDPVDAFVMGDRIAVLEKGRVVQAGTEAELLSRPRTPFVADLIGLNFHRVDLAAGTGLKEARAGSALFHVLADGLSGQAHLAFAPSGVSLSTEAPRGSHQNVFQGRVRDVVPLTDRLRVVLDAAAPLAADITREAAQQLHIAPGVKIWASVKATAIRVYP